MHENSRSHPGGAESRFYSQSLVKKWHVAAQWGKPSSARQSTTHDIPAHDKMLLVGHPGQHTAHCPVGHPGQHTVRWGAHDKLPSWASCIAHNKALAHGRLPSGPTPCLRRRLGAVSCFSMPCGVLQHTTNPSPCICGVAHGIEPLSWRSLPCEVCHVRTHDDVFVVGFSAFAVCRRHRA
jgi:hypothetical protein